MLIITLFYFKYAHYELITNINDLGHTYASLTINRSKLSKTIGLFESTLKKVTID